MRKGLIAFILSIGPAFGSYAQDIFNKTYMNIHTDSSVCGEFITKILEVNDGYVYIMNSMNVNTNEYEMIFERIDFSGNRLISKKYGEPNKRYLAQDMILLTPDSNFLVGGGIITNAALDQPWFMAKLDMNGDTLWFKTGYLDVDSGSMAWEVIQTSDNGYAIAGQSRDLISNELNFFLLKTDSTGNELWHRQYGGSNSEGAYSVIETEDRGFMIVGQTRSFGAGENDGYLVKTDSLGNQSWQKTFGSGSLDGFMSISKTGSGDYILAGGANYTGNRAWLLKVDSLGNTIWNKYNYLAPKGGIFYNAKVLPNGNIMAVGLSDNSKHTSHEMGVMYLVDASGDSIWSQIYTDSSDWKGSDAFYSFTSTSDGGYIACGQALRYHGFSTESNDGWIVKVDSNGCFNSECDFYDFILESRPELKSMTIYPNPTSSKIRISIPEAVESIEIYNVLGEIVFYSTSEKLEIDLSAQPDGIYFVNARTRDGFYTSKVLKQ